MSEAKVKVKKERQSTRSVRFFEDVFMVMFGEEIEKNGAGEVVRRRVLSFPCKNVGNVGM